MSRRRKRARKSAASRSVPRQSNVVSLDAAREVALALSDVSKTGPEQGQRTPQPTIQRWDRGRFSELSLDRLTTILRKAEDGDVEELADLWLRMLKTDAHLASVWESRMAPIYSARWEINAPETARQSHQDAVRLAQGCSEVVASIPNLPAVLSALLNARGLGYSVAEIIWKRGRILGVEGWTIAEIRPVHGRRFRFSDFFELGLYDNGTAVQSLREAGWPVQTLRGRGVEIAALPAGKYVVHQPAGIHDYPTATGLVHPVSRWWWVKQAATKYWLAGAEVAANPRIIGKILQTAVGATTVEDFHAGLESLAADGVMVLREGTDVDIHDGKATASSQVWDMLFRRMDLAISKIVLGSTLNVEVDESGGNRSLGESQDTVTIRPRQQQDAAQVWTTLRRDVFRFVRDYNKHLFAPQTPLPVGRSVLVEEQVTIDQLVVDSGAVTIDELRQSRGLLPLGGEVGARFVAPITRQPQEAVLPVPPTSPQGSEPGAGPGAA